MVGVQEDIVAGEEPPPKCAQYPRMPNTIGIRVLSRDIEVNRADQSIPIQYGFGIFDG